VIVTEVIKPRRSALDPGNTESVSIRVVSPGHFYSCTSLTDSVQVDRSCALAPVTNLG